MLDSRQWRCQPCTYVRLLRLALRVPVMMCEVVDFQKRRQKKEVTCSSCDSERRLGRAQLIKFGRVRRRLSDDLGSSIVGLGKLGT